MPLPILAALGKALPYITTAWSLYSQSQNKPKKEDYVPTGAAYQRYLNHLRSQTTESRTYHQRMRPALRQIGAQTQRGQRQVGYQVARQKPGGGIEAQMRMGINQQALEAIGIASEKASIAQEQVNVRTGEQLLRIGVQEEAALQRYQRDKKQFTKQMFTSTVQAGLNLANVAVQQHVADTKLKMEAAKDAKEARDTLVKQFETAKALGYISQSTKLETYVNDVEIAGYKNPDIYNKYRGIIQKREETFKKDKEKEAQLKQSAERLGEFNIELRGITDQQKALDLLNAKYEPGITSADYSKAVTKISALKPDALKPLNMEIELAGGQHRTKDLKNLVNKVYNQALTNPNISPDYIAKIAKIQQKELDYQQEIVDTNQNISDEEADKKTEEILLKSSIVTLQETVIRWAKTFSADIDPLKNIAMMSERNKYVKKLITTLKGIDTSKGMTLEDSTGLKRAIAGIIRTAESSEFGDMGLPTKKILTNLEIQLIDRVDAMLKKTPYVGDFNNNDPLGLF